MFFFLNSSGILSNIHAFPLLLLNTPLLPNNHDQYHQNPIHHTHAQRRPNANIHPLQLQLQHIYIAGPVGMGGEESGCGGYGGRSAEDADYGVYADKDQCGWVMLMSDVFDLYITILYI